MGQQHDKKCYKQVNWHNNKSIVRPYFSSLCDSMFNKMFVLWNNFSRQFNSSSKVMRSLDGATSARNIPVTEPLLSRNCRVAKLAFGYGVMKTAHFS